MGLELRYALRGLLRSPVSTLAAVFALALGIGAGTAVFSVVDRILFRSLPYPDGQRLVSFGMVAPIAPQEFMLGYDYLDWRDAQKPFESIGSWAGVTDCDLNETNPVRLRLSRIDSTLLPTLGMVPVAGRNFERREETPDQPRVAIISQRLWHARFAGDHAIIGRTAQIDGQPTTIVGILPPDFELPTLERPDVLMPVVLDEPEQRSRRSAMVVYAVGRLRPGVAPGQAAAALQPLLEKSLESVTPAFRKDIGLRIRPVRDRQVQDARLVSWILLGAVFAVILIACANVANLLLARGAAREHELAVRAALGAGRGRLIRHALAESLLLALAGGAAGCALAFILLRVFVSIAPEGIPRLQQAGLDFRVLLFAFAVSVLCAILFGLAPAVQTPRAEALAGWRSIGGPRRSLRQALVAAQVCLSLILLSGAGLLLRSLWNLQHQPLGMNAESVVTASIALGRHPYPDPARRLAFFEQLEARLRKIPGVSELAIADSLPPSNNPMAAMLYGAIDVEGRPRVAAGAGGTVTFRVVTPRYFAALRIPILRGRGFEETDRDPNRDVVILSDALARRLFPGEDPLGRRIQPGRHGPWETIVGVVADVKNNGLVDRPNPEYYYVRKHSPGDTPRMGSAIVRTPMDPHAMARWMRAEIAALDPTLPVTVETIGERVGRLAARPRFNAMLLGLFAAMGLCLAAVGLYGVISFLVAQRTAEIGVRMALGATPAAISRMVLRHAAAWTAAGALAGLAGSLFAVRLLERMLFQVSARDPWTLPLSCAVLFAAALAAAWIPARRAARIDPTQALREIR